MPGKMPGPVWPLRLLRGGRKRGSWLRTRCRSPGGRRSRRDGAAAVVNLDAAVGQVEIRSDVRDRVLVDHEVEVLGRGEALHDSHHALEDGVGDLLLLF